MTHALAPDPAGHLSGGWAVLGFCIAVACLTLVTGATGCLVAALDDPAGAVRGKIDPSQFADLEAGIGVAPFYLRAANIAERNRAVRCLTDAIYYEAAQEPVEGQRAIAQVVINRLRDRHFPKSVCGVVYEGWERKTGCQFSFVCDGSIARRRADPAVWNRLRPLADQALDGYVAPDVGTATHYHATYVRPNWIRSVAQIAAVGNHVFYRWKGRAGLPSALRGSYGGGEFQIADQVLDGLRRISAPPGRRELGRRRAVAAFRLASVHPLRGRNHGGRSAGRGLIRLT